VTSSKKKTGPNAVVNCSRGVEWDSFVVSSQVYIFEGRGGNAKVVVVVVGGDGHHSELSEPSLRGEAACGEVFLPVQLPFVWKETGSEGQGECNHHSGTRLIYLRLFSYGVCVCVCCVCVLIMVPVPP